MKRDIFKNISPLDHRYSLNKEQFERYERYFSEEAVMMYQARVELALVRAYEKRGIAPEGAAEEVEYAIEDITIEEIYEEEKRTRHNTRALVNVIRKRVREDVRPYIHLGVTSFDIIDTGAALRYKEATKELILPVLKRLEGVLMDVAEREISTLQIGRTHGQHAEPITFGFALSEYISRLGTRIEEIDSTSKNLRGKISGAVGAYNALSLIVPDPIEFEREVLSSLGLTPGTHSTQIVEPEYMVDFIHAIISCFGVLANLADDMRHLQRTEISEVGEYFDKDQVGSSTMPHKRNPINYENVKSLWKEFAPRMITLYMDQISEHQRDLTNSASFRFIPEIIVGFLLASERLIRVFERFAVSKEDMKKNFEKTKDKIIAEPLYILLAYYGHKDAHEAVRRLTLLLEREDIPLLTLIQNNPDLKPYIERFTKSDWDILKHPEKYIGKAEEKAREVIKTWKERLNI